MKIFEKLKAAFAQRSTGEYGADLKEYGVRLPGLIIGKRIAA